jgi:hypothetical protein
MRRSVLDVTRIRGRLGLHPTETKREKREKGEKEKKTREKRRKEKIREKAPFTGRFGNMEIK